MIRGKYLVQNPAGNAFLTLADWALNILTLLEKAPPKKIRTPKKILLSNGAHLGDVLLSTGILRLLKEAFPEAEIGFLTGSWSRHILEDHPLIDRIHLVDHWKLNRSNRSRWQKIVHYMRTRSAAKKEIRGVEYDLAVEIYPFFPNNIPLLYEAAIPIRIGYTSGGFGPLLTHSLDWSNENKSILWYGKELIRTFLLESREPSSYLPYLYPDCLMREEIRSRLSGEYALKEPYIAFHMGTGSALKEWPTKNWKTLVALFSKTHCRIVLTGMGTREKANIDQVKSSNPGLFVDLCDRLDWKEFVTIIGGAELLVAVDSVAGHVAAAADTPCIVIGNGLNAPAHWHPLSESCRVLIHSVPCAPCYQSRGCEGMECIAETTPFEVFEASKELLERARKKSS